MNSSKIIAFCTGLVLLAVSPIGAQEPTPTDAPPTGSEVVTRAELVTDLDKIISNWEKRSGNYVTKDEINDLRTLLTQIREEMGDLGERTGELETTVDEQKGRSENTGRPGF